MIQRKQTLFLILAALLTLVCAALHFEWIDLVLLVSAALSVYTIFIYRKRMLQARLCLIGIGVLLGWYILLAVVQRQILSTVESLPMISAILLFLARKGVLDDEKLVRAADRIR